jgi:hypothetical protein
MTSERSRNLIATINNRQNGDQIVDILYVKDENAFVTSGIQACFAEREILIPAHLVITDLELMGAIVSAILEQLSAACESSQTFCYPPQFVVLGRSYTLTEQGPYMRMDRDHGGGDGG